MDPGIPSPRRLTPHLQAMTAWSPGDPPRPPSPEHAPARPDRAGLSTACARARPQLGRPSIPVHTFTADLPPANAVVACCAKVIAEHLCGIDPLLGRYRCEQSAQLGD